MPLYTLTCLNGHEAEEFCHTAADKGCRTHVCPEPCGATMSYGLSVGRGLTYFEEGRGRWIHNLGDQPVYITSHEQHKAEMKKAGVEWVTERAVQGRGGWI